MFINDFLSFKIILNFIDLCIHENFMKDQHRIENVINQQQIQMTLIRGKNFV